MHGVYHFLMHLDAEPEAGETAERRERRLVAEAQGEFEYWAESACDDNNWSNPLALTLKDNTHIFCDANRKPEEGADYNWAAANTFAAQCVAIDLGVHGAHAISLGEPDAGSEAIEKLSYVETCQAIEKEGPRQLVEVYQRLAEGKPPREPWHGQRDASFESYLRRKTVALVEAYQGAVHKPFCRNGDATPYEYRAFDLTNGLEEPNAILTVDIHT